MQSKRHTRRHSKVTTSQPKLKKGREREIPDMIRDISKIKSS
jgi:hypothetical protein